MSAPIVGTAVGAGPDRLERLPGAERTEAERLRSVAAEFEAILLGQMLREMRESTFEDKDKDEASSPLADSLYAELSVALSRAGGLGIARVLTQGPGETSADPGIDSKPLAGGPGSENSGV